MRASLSLLALFAAASCGRVAYDGADASIALDAGGDLDAGGSDASDALDASTTRDDGGVADGSANGDAGAACQMHLGAGREHFCAVLPGGNVVCWGQGDLGQIGDGSMMHRATPTPVALAGPAVDVNGGRYDTCAALASGVVQCWGEGTSGQLGHGSATSSPTPVTVETIGDVVEVAVGAIHSCARQRAGQVYCWGNGAEGRLGNGGSGILPSPVEVMNMSDAGRLGMSGGSTTCAIRADGTLWCWGNNAEGSVGDGTRMHGLVPTPVSSAQTFIDADARDETACAIDATSRVWCWGYNPDGQVGTGDTTTPQLVPVQVRREGGGFLDGAIEVSLGVSHACALLSTGEVHCWGSNASGQLGRDTGGAGAPSAAPVQGLPPVVHVDSSAFSNCAVDASGGVWCWGEGGSGQLGDGAMTSRLAPARSFEACPP